MVRTHRLSTAGALILCFVGTEFSGVLLASGEQPTTAALSSQSVLDVAAETARTAVGRPRLAFSKEALIGNLLIDAAGRGMTSGTLTFPSLESSFLAQRGWRRDRGVRHRNGAAQAEMILGAVASITGGAVLAYANRPECKARPTADGCGYGTKVVGGAVLTGGMASLLVGALTWR
jgi:hypothetical protein